MTTGPCSDANASTTWRYMLEHPSMEQYFIDYCSQWSDNLTPADNQQEIFSLFMTTYEEFERRYLQEQAGHFEAQGLGEGEAIELVTLTHTLNLSDLTAQDQDRMSTLLNKLRTRSSETTRDALRG